MVVYDSEPFVMIRLYVTYSGKGYFHVLNKNRWPVNLCGLNEIPNETTYCDFYQTTQWDFNQTTQ